MEYDVSPEIARKQLQKTLSHAFGVTPEEATDQQIYKSIVLIVNDMLRQGRLSLLQQADCQQTKQVYYVCMEFLMGRSLKNTLFNLGITEAFRTALADWDIKLEAIYEQEPDAGLGNGGLGRLAACYLDALASGGYAAMGYCICYEYGIFRQKLIDGWQTELPDFWLPGGEVWLTAHPDQAVEVRFDGTVREWWDETHHHICHEQYTSVMAIPHDLMVAGYNGKGVAVLRLWSARAPGLDMKLFNDGAYMQATQQNTMAEVISQVLYPADNHYEGKSLRLRQQYFLVSASVQDIVHRHLQRYNTLDCLPEKAVIHTNDTHPVLAIPELMRILLDECGYSWDNAWQLVTRTVAYTNHTVMQEALECWPITLFEQRLPRIFQIVTEIDHRHRRQVWEQTGDAALVERTAIIADGTIHMARLAVAACYSVNGVSQLHSQLIKDQVFHDFYTLTPSKFTNVTNGIAHRRWLNQANPMLADFITQLIGPDFIQDCEKLSALTRYQNDSQVKDRWRQIKQCNKQRLADYIHKQTGVLCNPHTLFDVQIKRLHEYKRQHMNLLHIAADYLYLKHNPKADFVPKTYIFGAKAAPGYWMAKQIIQMIYALGTVIGNDPAMQDRLQLIYLEDYRVSLAELLVPAAEISQQISLAGTEASGTGNMKLMLNGAVTLGTEDGANIEIHKAVGSNNILLFGMTAKEAAYRRQTYDPKQYYYNNPTLKQVIDFLRTGLAGHTFHEVLDSLLQHDPYMVLADFESYCRIHETAGRLYRQPEVWSRMSLMNTAMAGRFAADRAVRQYAETIWHCKPVE